MLGNVGPRSLPWICHLQSRPRARLRPVYWCRAITSPVPILRDLRGGLCYLCSTFLRIEGGWKAIGNGGMMGWCDYEGSLERSCQIKQSARCRYPRPLFYVLFFVNCDPCKLSTIARALKFTMYVSAAFLSPALPLNFPQGYTTGLVKMM